MTHLVGLQKIAKLSLNWSHIGLGRPTCIDGVDQFRTPVFVWYTQKSLDPAADAVIGRAFSRLLTISQYIRVDHRRSWTRTYDHR